MNNYKVATGIVLIAVSAGSPEQALWLVKKRIHARTKDNYDPEIGMSLKEALVRGELDFAVMNEDRTALLCGELRGDFQPEVSRELADALRRVIPDNLYYQTRSTSGILAR